ncbi:hypothetical protein CMUS01_15363 [Colletotrichum musicola]|uniref:Uncharacterized protein n=1 Tax=Colletotrichum musicola TaxID=2175873 RepID=A0A8H6IXE3_9PEZI|nr:hypothetical protein CMUS01_15363 [Colletotrichum musicola]
MLGSQAFYHRTHRGQHHHHSPALLHPSPPSPCLLLSPSPLPRLLLLTPATGQPPQSSALLAVLCWDERRGHPPGRARSPGSLSPPDLEIEGNDGHAFEDGDEVLLDLGNEEEDDDQGRPGWARTPEDDGRRRAELPHVLKQSTLKPLKKPTTIATTTTTTPTGVHPAPASGPASAAVSAADAALPPLSGDLPEGSDYEYEDSDIELDMGEQDDADKKQT